ncbi:hypothetical protein L226DRAFT_519379 [Lentinus tigrinus ALCF2SS1-7]|uniref:uncharacterized protein n=1 Tax=Lentinus tigrinus ALCF2SS1-7 TaxID=1328758 RepID=UPI00116612F6|nr:hypothetical protein L226DRAFT_519379 [Lentinus tigrinus ALCF2SS1-7]
MPLIGIDFGVLHSKALIGILLSSDDSRVKGVLEDLAEARPARQGDHQSCGQFPIRIQGSQSRREAPTSHTRAPPDPRKGDNNVVHATHNHGTDSLYPGESGYSNAASSISSSDLGPRRQQVPTLLLLTMFSLAARYSPSMADVSPPWSEDSTTWTMGDEHMEEAKVILGVRTGLANQNPMVNYRRASFWNAEIH